MGWLMVSCAEVCCLPSRCRPTTPQVMRSYREAQQVTDALADLGVLLRFACMWDPKAYKRRQHTVAGLRRDTQLIRYMRCLVTCQTTCMPCTTSPALCRRCCFHVFQASCWQNPGTADSIQFGQRGRLEPTPSVTQIENIL